MIETTAAALAASWPIPGAFGRSAFAQEKRVTFYLCLLVTPANPAKASANPAQLRLDHLANLKIIMAGGKGAIAGPAVEAGLLAAEMHTRYVSKGALS